MSFVRFVEDQSWPTLRACLQAACGYFGGVPRQVLFDNMKTVVLEPNAYGRGLHRLHPGLLALSRDLGFAVRLCRPYRARTKGKVERFNRYLRESFHDPPVSRLQADAALDVHTANLEVLKWLRDAANVRYRKGTGARPLDRLLAEQDALRFPLSRPWRPCRRHPGQGSAAQCHLRACSIRCRSMAGCLSRRWHEPAKRTD